MIKVAARARGFVARGAVASERIFLRFSRWVRPAPEITILRASGSSVTTQSAPRRRFEIIDGSMQNGLDRARGRWVIALASDETLGRDAIAETLRAATRRVPIVPVASGRLGSDGLFCAAMMNAGTAIPTATARRVGAVAQTGSALVVFRARAVAALNRVPTAAAVPPPMASEATGGCMAWLDAALQIEQVVAKGKRAADTLRAVRRQLLVRAGAAAGVGADRRRLLDEAESRALTDDDFAAINSGPRRDLVIVYGFPPFVDTSGFVVAKRRAQMGRPYDAIVQDVSTRRALDHRSLELIRRDLRKRIVLRGELSNGAWRGIERYCRDGMAAIEAEERTHGTYASLYSRSMWIAPSILAALYKVRHPGVPWTAEISDPLVYRTDGVRRPNRVTPNAIFDEITSEVERRGLPAAPNGYFFDNVEWMIYSLADKIIFTNDQQRELMLDFYPEVIAGARAREISVAKEHPIPTADWYTRVQSSVMLPRGVVTIGYFGNFYGARGLDHMLDPIALLDDDERARVRLLIFTETGDEVRAEAAQHPAGDVIEVSPVLGYLDYLATLKRLDWLIITDMRRPDNFPINPYLPSKYAEYAGSGTKTWAIVEDGSVLSRKQFAARSLLSDPRTGAVVLREAILPSRFADLAVEKRGSV